MESHASRQLLKVLNGPHAGCEVLLPVGDDSIGADEANDIVLADEAIAPRHARLTIHGEAVDCLAIEGLIQRDGSDVESTRLTPFKPFTLGETHLAVGPADAKWPAISLPRATVRETPLPSEVADSQKQSVSQTAANKAAEGAHSGVSSAAADRSEARWGASRGAWAAIAALGLFFAGFLALLAWLAKSGNAEAPVVSREVQQAALETAIAKLGSKEFVTVTDEQHRFTVAGHVGKPKEKRELREAVLGLDPTVRVRLCDTESLASAVDGMLRMYKLSYSAAAGKPGEVIVRGNLEDREKWNKFSERIRKDLPQLARLTEEFSNVPTQASASPSSSNAIGGRDSAADDSVAHIQSPPAVSVVAQPANPKPKPADPAPRLPPIQSINVGNLQSITLATGEHLYRGAVLPSGFVVTDILADRVVLTRAGRQHIIKIGI